MITTETTMADREDAKPGILQILTTMDRRRHAQDSTALKPMFQSRLPRRSGLNGREGIMGYPTHTSTNPTKQRKRKK